MYQVCYARYQVSFYLRPFRPVLNIMTGIVVLLSFNIFFNAKSWVASQSDIKKLLLNVWVRFALRRSRQNFEELIIQHCDFMLLQILAKTRSPRTKSVCFLGSKRY